MPKVSIIVPVYNAADYLDRCIGSVLAQDLQEGELLLVDDGSSDDSVKICQKYEEQDSRIQVLYNQHGGAASARNKALAIAKGEFIAFLDADDCYHSEYLSALYQAAVSNHAEVAACGTLRGGDAAAFLASPVEASFSVISHDEYLHDMYTSNWPDTIAPYTKIYHRDLSQSLVFPEGKCFEDAATMFKPVYYAQRIAITDAALYYYNITPNSASSTQKGDELLDREEALRGHVEFYREKEEKDFEELAAAFYLEQLIIIWHKMRGSDHPEYADRIIKQFKSTLNQYPTIKKSPGLNEKAFAFLHPHLGDIKHMINEEGFLRTIRGFVRRKLGKK